MDCFVFFILHSVDKNMIIIIIIENFGLFQTTK